MAIVKILGNYRGKKDKSNLDKFIVKKLNCNIDKEFSQEIFMENFLIEKTIQLNHNSQFKTFNLILFLIFKEKT